MGQSPVITSRHHGRLAFVEVANPPVNALGLSLRTQLHLELQRASSAREVDAIVLTGAGRLFMSGADISELDQPIEPPGLLDLEAQISRLPMPVIAAVHGPVLGGGLLIALMCDYRVAHVGATFGFPEVKLGLLPTFGGTQIFPRLVGIERASDLITSGRSISAEQARACGIVDSVDANQPSAAGAAFAATGPLPKRRLLELPWPQDPGSRRAVDKMREVVSRASPLFLAPRAALDAIECGFNLPLGPALQHEGELFEQLRNSGQSKALRRLFFAERRGARGPWSVLVGSKASGPINMHDGRDGSLGSGEDVAFFQAGLMARSRAVEIVRALNAPDETVADAIARAKSAGLTSFVSSGRSSAVALLDAARTEIVELERRYGAAAVGFSLRYYGIDTEMLTAVAGSITAGADSFDDDGSIPDCLRTALRKTGDQLMRQRIVADGDILDALCVAALGWPRYHADIFV